MSVGALAVVPAPHPLAARQQISATQALSEPRVIVARRRPASHECVGSSAVAGYLRPFAPGEGSTHVGVLRRSWSVVIAWAVVKGQISSARSWPVASMR